MYSKVVLNPVEAEIIYKEPIQIDEEGYVMLETPRVFQEFLGVISFSDGCAISKGQTKEIYLAFPDHIPCKRPLKNWFQIALLSGEETLVADPLGCSARYKGFLPGMLQSSTLGFHKFILEDEPRAIPIDYVLFIYDSADYQAFLEGVNKFFEDHYNHGKNAIQDHYGNHILVSDESKQPMILVPVQLLIGGKEYICTTWEYILKK